MHTQNNNAQTALELVDKFDEAFSNAQHILNVAIAKEELPEAVVAECLSVPNCSLLLQLAAFITQTKCIAHELYEMTKTEQHVRIAK